MNRSKIAYYIWIALLLAMMFVFVFVDTDFPVLTIMIIALFAGALLLKSWKTLLVEIVVEEGAVHLKTYDGKTRSIIPRGVIKVSEADGKLVVGLSDGSEYRAKKGKVKIIVGDEVLREFREEDFPYAEIIM